MGDKLYFQGYPFDPEPPPGWAISTLGKIAESVRPGFASGQHNKDGEGIPHLRPMNISAEGEINLLDLRYVSSDANSLRIKKGDVLFNNTNSQKWVGKTAVVKDKGEYAFSNHMTRIELNNRYVNSQFIAGQLHYLSTSGYFQVHCKKHVNQASISGRDLENSVPLLIPPFNEQQRIVAKIEKLQAHSRRAREALESIPALLEQLRQSILAAAFRGDLTKKWREDHPDSEAEVRTRVKVRCTDAPLTFRELSEGEQQLLMVLGLLRFTREDESLFLLDDPDAHLNPAWSVRYLNFLKDTGGPGENGHMIMATHDPLLLTMPLLMIFKVSA